jgi:uncharacterized membrane protein
MIDRMTKIRVALGVSLALNLFLIGALSGGAAWMNYGHRMIPAGSLRVAGSELPAEQRQAFRKTLRQARVGVSDQIMIARNARVKASELLRASDLDQAALRETLNEARAADFRVRSAVEKEALKFAASLPLEDRLRLADAIEKRNDRSRRRRHPD